MAMVQNSVKALFKYIMIVVLINGGFGSLIFLLTNIGVTNHSLIARIVMAELWPFVLLYNHFFILLTGLVVGSYFVIKSQNKG